MRQEMGVVYLKSVHALFICYLFDHPIHDAAKPTFLEAFSHVSRSDPSEVVDMDKPWDRSAAVANNTVTARIYMACRPHAMASTLLVVSFAFNLRIRTPRRELCSFRRMLWIRKAGWSCSHPLLVCAAATQLCALSISIKQKLPPFLPIPLQCTSRLSCTSSGNCWVKQVGAAISKFHTKHENRDLGVKLRASQTTYEEASRPPTRANPLGLLVRSQDEALSARTRRWSRGFTCSLARVTVAH